MHFQAGSRNHQPSPLVAEQDAIDNVRSLTIHEMLRNRQLGVADTGDNAFGVHMSAGFGRVSVVGSREVIAGDRSILANRRIATGNHDPTIRGASLWYETRPLDGLRFPCGPDRVCKHDGRPAGEDQIDADQQSNNP